MPSFLFTDNVVDVIVARYCDGESSGSLARSFGVSDVTILNYLKRRGISRRGPSEARREYPIWDGAFSTITPESAYWIGFLMADGCVLDESKVQVGLSQSDRAHLEKLRRYLRTEARPIYDVPQNKSAVLKFHSKQIVSDLKRFGVVPRKSNKAKARGRIQKEPAFWLGVMDGDGSVDSFQRGRVRMYGTRALMEQFASFAEQKLMGYSGWLKPTVSRHSDSLWAVCIEGQRAKSFLSLAYKSSPVYLDRKWITAHRCLNDQDTQSPA